MVAESTVSSNHQRSPCYNVSPSYSYTCSTTARAQAMLDVYCRADRGARGRPDCGAKGAGRGARAAYIDPKRKTVARVYLFWTSLAIETIQPNVSAVISGNDIYIVTQECMYRVG